VPVYQYACTECGHELEVRQSFTDDPLSECPTCDGRLRKVLSAVGVVFKGSGFYRTDSRKDSGDGAAAKGSDGTSSGASGRGTDSKSDTGGKDASTSGASGNGSNSTGSSSTSGSRGNGSGARTSSGRASRPAAAS
jgi:putative FmdB family regulatory protein